MITKIKKHRNLSFRELGKQNIRPKIPSRKAQPTIQNSSDKTQTENPENKQISKN